MNKKTIHFTVQSDLFGYLKPKQKDMVRPVLRLLKKPAQEELCCALLDYLETDKKIPPRNVILGGMFIYIVEKFRKNENVI